MASQQLEDEIYEYALDYKNRRDFVSMVCGAEYKSTRNCNKSGLLISETDFYPRLMEKLLNYGSIGMKVDKTSVGCCAEVNASNDIYKQHKIELNEISLSKAYRPKSMQIKNKCQICKEVFY
jgi:hypothetical protein